MTSTTEKMSRRSSRAPILLVVLVLLLGSMWRAGVTGLGSWFAIYGAATNRLSAADSSVRFSSGNADSHYVRATILEASDLPAAVREHYEAVRARPDDYALWLSRARALELNGDLESAIEAARQAIPLAPSYAQPHYQLGNFLLRAGRTTEALAELRLAGASDPMLMPGIIDLAWSISHNDPKFVEQAIAATSPDQHLVLAMFFKEHQQIDAAIRAFAMSGAVGAQDRRAYVQQLITGGRFESAAELWKVDNSEGAVPDAIRNPGFEKEVELDGSGFDWSAPRDIQGVRVTIDTQTPAEGQSALKLEFAGGAPFGSPFLSQVVLVTPQTHYALQVSVRSESLVSGGLPQVLVLDALSNSPLGQSPAFTGTSDGWRQVAIPFASGSQTKAVRIAIERPICSSSPCPVFGRLWLDGFALRKS
jgi:hypothetical protein